MINSFNETSKPSVDAKAGVPTLIDGRPVRYSQLQVLIAAFRPRSIIEVGTNRGDGGLRMCEEALKYQRCVSYVGFDVFDSQDEQFHRSALNGKGAFSRIYVTSRFDELRKIHSGFSFELIEGLTSETLHGRSVQADFVFLDGDHRVGTIARDFEALKSSKVIVLDDYYDPEVTPGNKLVEDFGCNQLVDQLPNVSLLPLTDVFSETGKIRMVLIIKRLGLWSRLSSAF